MLSSGLVNARASAWLQVGGGPSQYTEFGSTGRTMVIPSSGTVYRFTRLGVITVPTQTDSVMTVNVGVACDAGSAGPIGVDMAVIVPARRRAASITGVSSSGYPVFLQQFADVRKRINSDLTGELFPVSGLGFGPDSGLGGALIQPLAGALDTLIDVHEMIPDDPTASASGDPLGQAITTALDVVPRSYLLRGA